MKRNLLAITLLATGILAACNGTNSDEEVSKEKEPVNIKELVQGFSSKTIDAESASITSEQLMVTEKDGNEKTYDLTDGEFFVSIAPYENQTHP